MEDFDEQRRMSEQPLNDASVIFFISNDIPRMTEAQLAELLTNLFLDGLSVVATALVPLARVELERRRLAQAGRITSST